MTDPKLTPPPELVQQWTTEARSQDYCSITEQVAFHAAQWGADQELEACCEWLQQNCGRWEISMSLSAARRPKPPTLKEQALAVLESVAVHELYGNATADNRLSADDMRTIRLALEALPDD
jgi:hypothetical protein